MNRRSVFGVVLLIGLALLALSSCQTGDPDESDQLCTPMTHEMYESVEYLAPDKAAQDRSCNYYAGELLIVARDVGTLYDFLDRSGLSGLFATRPNDLVAAPIDIGDLNETIQAQLLGREDNATDTFELAAFEVPLAEDLVAVFEGLESELDASTQAELAKLPDEWRAVWHVNQAVLNQQGDNAAVLADVNYRLSLDIAGDPSTGGGLIGGDPSTGGGLIGGDPSTGGGLIGGDPATAAVCSGTGVAAQATAPIPTQAPDATMVTLLQGVYPDQWAFGTEPGVFRDAAHEILENTGKDVEIAIFDSMPFDAAGLQTINWAPNPFQILVEQPVNVPSTTLCNLAFDEHGLFIAGLAHEIAPGAQLRLIEVLNSANQGQLIDLIQALEWYRLVRLAENNGTMANTVINLSLGIDPDTPVPELLNEQVAALRALGSETIFTLLLPGATDGALDHLPAVGLNYALWRAHLLGAVVVAASGNDSGSLTAPQPAPQPQQVPAAFAQVIGVSGNNAGGSRSCFANTATPDLMAPAGEGLTSAGGCDTLVTVGACVDASKKNPITSGAVHCDEAVIGLVTFRFTQVGYIYWAGTSFSAPLVSGLSALILGQTPGEPPGQVADRLHCAVNDNGVISTEMLQDACP